VDGGCYIDILQSMGMMGGSVVDEDWVWPWKGTPASDPAPESASAVKLTDWAVLPVRDDVAVKHALFTKGPLSVALNVVDEAMYYADGVQDVQSCLKPTRRIWTTPSTSSAGVSTR